MITIVLVSVAVCSTAFVIPEVKREKAKQISDIEAAAQWLTESITSSTSSQKPLENIDELFGGHRIVGYQICDTGGCQLQSGEAITGSEFGNFPIESVFQNDDTRMEITRSIPGSSRAKHITYRIDTAVFSTTYWTYFWTMIAQIVVTSFFALLTSMIATSIIIIMPTLRLKHRMRQAKQDPNHPKKYLLEVNQKDEIADLIVEFNDMLVDMDNYQTQISRANIDHLTGLPNRRMYAKHLSQLTSQLKQDLKPLSLLFIDLDNFKAINDTHGHKTGDELLVATAQRIRGSVSKEFFVSRIGGDEFTIIVPEIIDKPSLNAIGDKILSDLCKPFAINSHVFYISASIGITCYPQDADDGETLTMNADQALYASKDNGRNQYSYFSLPMRINAVQRMNTIDELRDAIRQKQFEVYYQPIVDFSTGRIVKAESLLRWNHPEKGVMSPAEIIGIAEDTGLIIDIGDWVFHEAINSLAKWRSQLQPDFEISINTSMAQYRDNGIDSTEWLRFISTKGVPFNAVVIEITETMVLDLSAPIKDRLDAFRDSGIKIALDDFGTGYSSLSYLNKIKSDYLKVDYSFVKDILDTQQSMDLCQKIIDIAHIYNMQVIAEGIEQEEQERLLRQANANYGQGYLYSKPIPASEFEALLIKQKQTQEMYAIECV